MAQYPDGIKYIITSKNENQNKGQVEAEFIPDSANGYYDGDAYQDANELFQELISTYSQNATKEFYFEKCTTYQYEIRPVPSSLRK